MEKPPITKLVLLKDTNPLINIILQCLSNIKDLIAYYLNPVKETKILKKSKNNPGNNYLGPSFLNLLDHLWKSNKNEFSPKEIHDTLKNLMKNDYNSNDAGLIIKYILNQLNKELNENENPIKNNEDDFMEHLNKDETFKKYINNMKENRTCISERFYSTIQIRKKCTNCSPDLAYYAYYYEPSPVIDVFLEVSQDNILNNLSFEEHLKSFLLEKENETIQEHCLFCDSQQGKLLSKDIITTPQVLIVNINRNNDKANKISFKYPLQFSGKNIINKDYDLPDYELTCVIRKVNNNNNMEYHLFYKCFVDNSWYGYNNTKIISFQDNYQKYISDDKNTCVIIYTKKH